MFSCNSCGITLFRISPKYKHHFCCRKCRDDFATRRVAVSCQQCKNEFFLKPYRIKKQKTFCCSTKCSFNLLRVGYIDAFGYRRISVAGKKMMAHRHIMEKKLRRLLAKNETVHHKNGRRDDNRLCNLELKVGAHGKHQTVKDRVRDAVETLKIYAPKLLRVGFCVR